MQKAYSMIPDVQPLPDIYIVKYLWNHCLLFQAYYQEHNILVK